MDFFRCLSRDTSTSSLSAKPKSKTNVDVILNKLKSHRNHEPSILFASGKNILSSREILDLMDDLKEVLKAQPMLVEPESPIKIVGDIHGQFLDLLRLFDHCQWPPMSRYLFLGDYVDRGPQGIETFALLAALKIKYPQDVWLLRGNHESSTVNKVYGFYDEIKLKYSVDDAVLQRLCDTFNYLPVAGLVGEKIFCMHGGLSPDLENFDQIRSIQRPCDVPEYGLMCDLLWADPEHGLDGWAESTRGVSFTFGRNVVIKFCERFKVAMIVRGHQLPDITRHRGYKFFAGTRMLTLFSAPHYCRGAYNDAAVLKVEKDLICSFEILRPDPRIVLAYKKFKR